MFFKFVFVRNMCMNVINIYKYIYLFGSVFIQSHGRLSLFISIVFVRIIMPIAFKVSTIFVVCNRIKRFIFLFCPRRKNNEPPSRYFFERVDLLIYFFIVCFLFVPLTKHTHLIRVCCVFSFFNFTLSGFFVHI